MMNRYRLESKIKLIDCVVSSVGCNISRACHTTQPQRFVIISYIIFVRVYYFEYPNLKVNYFILITYSSTLTLVAITNAINNNI